MPEEPTSKITLNQILYGPPGTGKTYHTVSKALEILGHSTIPEFNDRQPNSIEALKNAFPGQVEFVTFHQSFSYEDFVEGIRAETCGGNVHYKVTPGVFKTLCENAKSKTAVTTEYTIKPHTPIWKFSLGESGSNEAEIYWEEAIDNNALILGFGYDIDFSNCQSLSEIKDRLKSNKPDLSAQTVDKNAKPMDTFINKMKENDLVIISDGNLKFKAICRITGGYTYNPDSVLPQQRKVEWLRVYTPSRPYQEISTKRFTQATINQPRHIDKNKLQQLLKNADSQDNTKKNFVLIIDEINRGNMSRIFGELITLIEPSKRAEEPEAISLTLPYSGEKFSAPNNVYIIGTMNTADRSLALMDTALRRRFHFIEMMPNPCLLHEDLTPIIKRDKWEADTEYWEDMTSWDTVKNTGEWAWHKDHLGEDILVEGVNLRRLLYAINQRIEVLYDREHTIGHAFFMHLTSQSTIKDLEAVFEHKILPLLEEYFFDDWEKIRLILADQTKSDASQCFYKKIDMPEEELFPNWEKKITHTQNRYQRQLPKKAAAYIRIYDTNNRKNTE